MSSKKSLFKEKKIRSRGYSLERDKGNNKSSKKTPKKQKAERKVSEAVKKRVAGSQSFKCANKPASNLFRLINYKCPMWFKPGELQGSFDESGYEIDHSVELSISGDNDLENLQALCLCCHKVKTLRFMTKDGEANTTNQPGGKEKEIEGDISFSKEKDSDDDLSLAKSDSESKKSEKDFSKKSEKNMEEKLLLDQRSIKVLESDNDSSGDDWSEGKVKETPLAKATLRKKKHKHEIERIHFVGGQGKCGYCSDKKKIKYWCKRCRLYLCGKICANKLVTKGK